MYFEQNMAAGIGVEITDAADFLRIIASAADDVQIIFYKGGQEVGRVEQVGAGYNERIDFDRVRLTSSGGGMLRLITRKGATAGYDRPIGSVGISGTVNVQVQNAQQGAFTQSQKTVNTGSTQLAAAKANRRYLLIQNRDANAAIFVTTHGAAAAVVDGVRLNPGESMEIQGYAPVGAINAIALIANANIVVVEG